MDQFADIRARIAEVGKRAKFDGFRNGDLQDPKFPSYAKFVKNGELVSWFNGAEGLVLQGAETAGCCRYPRGYRTCGRWNQRRGMATRYSD